MYYSLVDELFKLAILEDIGHGDITSEIVVPKDCVAFAEIICKENLVLAGIPFIKRFFLLSFLHTLTFKMVFYLLMNTTQMEVSLKKAVLLLY